MGFLRTVCLILLLSFFAAAQAGAQAEDDNVGFRSVMELERSILQDGRWLEEADRLMTDLKAMDVQLHASLNRVTGPVIRNRLLRERNNIRRLIAELTEARNTIYARLEENRALYGRIELTPGAGTQVR